MSSDESAVAPTKATPNTSDGDVSEEAIAVAVAVAAPAKTSNSEASQKPAPAPTKEVTPKSLDGEASKNPSAASSKEGMAKASDGEASSEKPAADPKEVTPKPSDGEASKEPVSAPEKVTLMTSDGEVFEVEAAVAMESGMIKNMIEDGCAGGIIPLPNVKGPVLRKVIEFCRKHVGHPTMYGVGDASAGEEDEELIAWDKDFVNVDLPTLYDFILAANYLNIKCLLGLTSQAIADMIKGKKPYQIRAIFDIQKDFTPEEEAELERQNQWLYD